jgi:tRNA modification GTPase
MDTIFALASGRGRAGVAVIRISGPRSHEIVESLCGAVPEPRRASLRKIRWQGEILDEALVVTFAANASFTGEASAELHVHGGQAVVGGVFAALRAFDDVRIAEPGEFTRRALENGRMQLFQVEGLVDLIDAETEGQRRQAQRMLQGSLATKVSEWRAVLLHVTALIEATIDFVDEDVPVNIWPEVEQKLAWAIESFRSELRGQKSAERVRSGFVVAVYGPTNAGKSSLINAMVGRDVAIVSEIAGTTRDVIESRLDVDGLPVLLLDTAGLRESADPIETEGIRRARARIEDADVKVLMLDALNPHWTIDFEPDIRIAAKADTGWRIDGAIPVSSKTGEGLQDLRDAISAIVSAKASIAGVVVNERHRRGVQRAENAVEQAISMVKDAGEHELISAKLREARLALESLIGRIDVEDVLGEIFGRFCIGK